MSASTALVSQTQPAIGFAYGATIIRNGKRSDDNIIYCGLDRGSGKHEVRLGRDSKIYSARRVSEEDQQPHFEIIIRE